MNIFKRFWIVFLKYPLPKKNKGDRFKTWQESLPFLGTDIVCELVEMPDIKGMYKGITLHHNLDGSIRTAYITIGNSYVEFWKCKPIIIKK